MRYALGLQYDGRYFAGWQTQPAHHQVATVQDTLQLALSFVAACPIEVVCSGRTDAGVHALQQIVHFDTEADRPLQSWIRGVNAQLPASMAVRWVKPIDGLFNARFSAISRHYTYVLIADDIRPALAQKQAAWTHLPLDVALMQAAASLLIGEHDFSTFRASECQANTPVRTLIELSIVQNGKAFFIAAKANAFLHHMIRNIVGALIYVGSGRWSLAQFADSFAARDRKQGAPTFWPDGLYFCGAAYPEHFGLPAPMTVDPASTWPWAV